MTTTTSSQRTGGARLAEDGSPEDIAAELAREAAEKAESEARDLAAGLIRARAKAPQARGPRVRRPRNRSTNPGWPRSPRSVSSTQRPWAVASGLRDNLVDRLDAPRTVLIGAQQTREASG